MPAPASCAPVDTARFAALSVNPPVTDRPADIHADLNLALRGYQRGSASATYIWLGGDSDERAPQLSSMFQPPQRPPIHAVYQVRHWDWTHNQPGQPISHPPVTLISLELPANQPLYLPDSGYDIGQGYEALVLYAEPHRITLKYTREDNVIQGYTLHLENICVAPSLLELYNTLNARGRDQLPALRAGQAFAHTRATPLALAIRDNGSFMEARSRKDWWR
jgi:hypothetical protein